MDTDFKKQVRKDFAEVFLNDKEFGRTCLWNGKPLRISEDARNEEQAFRSHGVNRDSKVIYCRDVDLPAVPEVTEQINLDGDVWFVTDIRQPFAYVVITLSRTQA